ncbi:hypothetical protein GCM10008170_18120 [Methylopila capsulata]|uniref:Uncharacterized protein n=1 Tax=Methylopila capsulata TaxID=61654 RepID=A0A9W6ITA7_9HYPH|nr:hypothetical protein GCM10008170_18120 [Methylopila capsulata]
MATARQLGAGGDEGQHVAIGADGDDQNKHTRDAPADPTVVTASHYRDREGMRRPAAQEAAPRAPRSVAAAGRPGPPRAIAGDRRAVMPAKPGIHDPVIARRADVVEPAHRRGHDGEP